MGIDFSNPENQTYKHMIPIIHTNTQIQTHKHVHPHNKSKNFFSKQKQNPEVRNEREERGREKGWNRSCMSLIKLLSTPIWVISWTRCSSGWFQIGDGFGLEVLLGNKTQMERNPKNDLGQRLGQQFISFFPTLSFFGFVDEAGEFGCWGC